MKTDFTSCWERKAAACPLLADPQNFFTMNVEAIRLLQREAFENGLVHMAQTTKDLSRQAALEATDELLGPASLAPEFDEIFGRRRRVG